MVKGNLAKKILFGAALLALCVVSVTASMKADQPQVTVLLYHHVLPMDDKTAYLNNGLVISLESFTSQMEWLHNNGYHTITPAELKGFLYEKKPLPDKSVMLTFDDGYLSNYMFAYPILKQYGFKAVLFAITGGIQTLDQEFHADNLDMLSWMQVAASSDVFEYASHTNALHTPVDGKTGFVSATMDEARADLLLSQKRVNNKALFAYPLGQYTKDKVAMLKFNGVEMAFTVNKGYVNQNSDPLLLDRVTVYASFDLKTFENVVTCRYKYK